MLSDSQSIRVAPQSPIAFFVVSDPLRFDPYLDPAQANPVATSPEGDVLVSLSEGSPDLGNQRITDVVLEIDNTWDSLRCSALIVAMHDAVVGICGQHMQMRNEEVERDLRVQLGSRSPASVEVWAYHHEALSPIWHALARPSLYASGHVTDSNGLFGALRSAFCDVVPRQEIRDAFAIFAHDLKRPLSTARGWMQDKRYDEVAMCVAECKASLPQLLSEFENVLKQRLGTNAGYPAEQLKAICKIVEDMPRDPEVLKRHFFSWYDQLKTCLEAFGDVLERGLNRTANTSTGPSLNTPERPARVT